MKQRVFCLVITLMTLLTSIITAQNQGNTLIEGTLMDFFDANVIESGECVYYGCPIAELLYPRLLGIDSETRYYVEGAPDNSLVQAWDISANGLTYTFSLIHDRHWNDGTPITAQDVAFSLEAENYNYDDPILIQVLDNYTVAVTFETPTCANLNRVDTLVLPAHTFNSVDDYLSNGIFTPDVSYGPFMYAERQDDHLLLVANPDYHTPVQLVGYEFHTMESQDAMIDALENGSIHLMRDVPLYAQTDIAANHDLQTFAYAGDTWDYIGMNVGSLKFTTAGVDESGETIDQGAHPILGNRNVRRALQYGIDTQLLADIVYYGNAQPLASYITPLSWAYDPSVPRVGYNPDEAIRLLEAEGWVVGEEGIRTYSGNRYRDGSPLSLTLITNAGNDLRSDIAEILSAQLYEIGVELNVEFVDFVTLLDTIEAQNFDMYLLSWAEEFPDNPTPVYFLAENDTLTMNLNFGSYGLNPVQNLAGGENPTTDYNTFCSYETQLQTYSALQNMITDYQPYLWVATRNRMVAARNIAGFDPRPEMPLWNIEALTITTE